MVDAFDELARVDALGAAIATLQTAAARSAGRPQQGPLFIVRADGILTDRTGKVLREKPAQIKLNTARPEVKP